MSHRNRRIAFRLVTIAFFSFAGLWVSGVTAVPQQSAAQRREEAKKIKNPVESDSASVEEGRKLYARHCASCHGPQGKGDGGLALSGGTPSNLVDETWDNGSSDGEIFVVIRDGTSSDMEAYKDKLSEKQIWQVINYLRSIGSKTSKENR